jgi:hypothetical protein
MFDFGEIPGETEADRQDVYETRLLELQFEKLFTLFEHYDIPISSELRWKYLAYCLACEFFSGMDVVTTVRRRARPRTKRGLELKRMLVGVVDEILAEQPKLKIAAAIDIARERDPERWGTYEVSTLTTRYHELKKKAAQKRPNFPRVMLAEFLSEKP